MGTKSVAEKLGIKPKTAVWLSHPERLDLVAPLPADARLVDDLVRAAVALLFADDAGGLRGLLEANKAHLTRPGTLWVAYPKANRTDINRDTLWPIVGEYGLRPNGQVAVDDVWSALRFRALKEGEAPFKGGKPA